MKIELLADIFNANWETWQDYVFIILVSLAAVFLFFGLTFILVSNARSEADGKRMAKRVAWYEKQLKVKRRALEMEKEKGEQKLEESRRELEERRKEANDAETKANSTRQQIRQKRQELSELLGNLETTQKELAEYQKRDGTVVPVDVAVNCLTDSLLQKSELPMDSSYSDCRIPKGETFAYALSELTEYLHKKPSISYTAGTGKRPASFKYESKNAKTGKTFALVSDLGSDKFRMTLKCGPDYGSKLCKHLKNNVQVSAYPSGLLWFTVSNEKNPCSLELAKLLIDISYRIARLGF